MPYPHRRSSAVRVLLRQRIVRADFLVEPHFAEIKLEVLAEFRPSSHVQCWEFHHDRLRNSRAAGEVGPVQAAEESVADTDLFESAFAHVCAENLAEPCRSHGQGIDRERRHSSCLPSTPRQQINLRRSMGGQRCCGTDAPQRSLRLRGRSRFVRSSAQRYRSLPLAGRGECAVAVSSVRWRRRVCAGRFDCATAVENSARRRRVCTLGAVAAHCRSRTLPKRTMPGRAGAPQPGPVSPTSGRCRLPDGPRTWRRDSGNTAPRTPRSASDTTRR